MTNEIGKGLDLNVLYMDYNATTPLDPEVRKAIKRSVDEDWANPSSGTYISTSSLYYFKSVLSLKLSRSYVINN